MSVIRLSPFEYAMPSHSAGYKLFDVVPITVSKLRDNRISDNHWHDFLQIWYTVSGEYVQVINGKRIVQKAGSCSLVFPYMLHSIDSSGSDLSETEVFNISIKKGEFEKKCIPFLSHTYNTASFDSFSLSPSIVIPKDKKSVADKLCYDMYSEYQKNSAMFTTKMFSLVARLLEICIDSSGDVFSRREISSAKIKEECISEAIRFLSDNRTDNITIDNVSSAVLMSRRTFTDAFNSTVGTTCHGYLTSLRLSLVLEYLRYTEMTVAEIAGKCGFSDASHLYRVCLKNFKMGPLEIRHACGKWAREVGDALFRKSIKETGQMSLRKRIWSFI